jgi:hypothetical protein
MSILKFAWLLLALVRPGHSAEHHFDRAALRRSLATRLSPHLLKDVGADEG